MRRRIVALVAGMITLVVLAFVIPLAILVRHTVYQDATKSLQDKANRIANYLRSGYTSPTEKQIAAYLAALPGDSSACVELASGVIVGTQPPGGVPALPAGQPGEGNGDDHGGGPQQPVLAGYRSGQISQLTVLDPDTRGMTVVRVFATDSQLHSGETGWWLLLGGSAVGLLLVGIAGAELLTRRLVRPLVRTAETAQQLSVGEIGARAPVDGPKEIADVGKALNRLADRIDELIAEERETVADLSHRLRTPLTALRLDAEALRDPAEAERVGTHVSSLERLLTAVIHAARRPQREGRMPSCDATEVVGERVAFWSALTDEQGRACTVSLPSSPLPVRAAAEDFSAAVDALLENVIAHTPEGAAFAVRLSAAADGAQLEVSDEGPGIPDDSDVRGRSDRGSTGLGLDIARRCAEGSGGSMSIGRSPSGGALVTLLVHSP
ncbi:HAMP domain-containing sensor histidine kinase [Jatrophihabitans sp.]|uniref:HAMP domain-containing sensor histidine kinase n=1 Tax=Jatrophihabitans sp. TaxID=1932789 RepID=UPI0030C663F3|nr:Signal transduction histidine kinase [Jatrophihabitans sp.]